MSTQYTLQQGALGDVILLNCVNAAGQPVGIPANGVYSMTFIDPTGITTTHVASLIAPNYLSFTTSAVFNFATAGAWKAQGFITIGTSMLSKTNLVPFTVLPSLA